MKWKNIILLTISVTATFLLVLYSNSFHGSVQAVQNDPYKVPVAPTQQRVIIGFKDEIKEEIVKKKKGEILDKAKTLPILTATVPTNEIENLKSNPTIEFVEADFMFATLEQTIGWGPPAINAPNSWGEDITGKKVKIGIIDTGIAPHNDLLISGGKSFVDYTKSFIDDNGHGTHIAGIIGAKNNKTGIIGIAPDSQIYSIKVLDSNGEGYLSDIIAGIDWAITNKMDIINLSLGSPHSSSALQDVVDKAYKNGILITGAAGNLGSQTSDTINYPAKYSSVIAVGAVNSLKKWSDFSSIGNTLEVVAPGNEINSTYLSNSFSTQSGTSMATPFVSGILALYKEKYPTLSGPDIRKMLIEHTDDLGKPGRDPYYGFGLVQAPLVKRAEMKSFKVNKQSPQQVNSNITFTAESSNGSDVLYRFWIREGKDWRIAKDYSTSNQLLWTPSQSESYRISVHVKDKNSKQEYDDYMFMDYQINSSRVNLVKLITDKTSPQLQNTPIDIMTNATGGTSLLYRFWILEDGNWRIMQDFSQKNNYSWKPTKKGKFRISVHVKDKGSLRNYDDYKFFDYVINESKVKLNTLSINKPSPQFTGTDVQVTANASGGTKKLYRFWIREGEEWYIAKDFSTSNTFHWKPQKSGNYRISVHVKDQNSNKNYDDYKYSDFLIK